MFTLVLEVLVIHFFVPWPLSLLTSVLRRCSLRCVDQCLKRISWGSLRCLSGFALCFFFFLMFCIPQSMHPAQNQGFVRSKKVWFRSSHSFNFLVAFHFGESGVEISPRLIFFFFTFFFLAFPKFLVFFLLKPLVSLGGNAQKPTSCPGRRFPPGRICHVTRHPKKSRSGSSWGKKPRGKRKEKHMAVGQTSFFESLLAYSSLRLFRC